MNFFEEVADGLKEVFETMGQPVLFRGHLYRCIVGEGTQSVDLESGGLMPQVQFSVKFQERELQGERPVIGDIVEVYGQIFRIEQVAVRTGRGQVEVFLKPIQR